MPIADDDFLEGNPLGISRFSWIGHGSDREKPCRFATQSRVVVAVDPCRRRVRPRFDESLDREAGVVQLLAGPLERCQPGRPDGRSGRCRGYSERDRGTRRRNASYWGCGPTASGTMPACLDLWVGDAIRANGSSAGFPCEHWTEAVLSASAEQNPQPACAESGPVRSRPLLEIAALRTSQRPNVRDAADTRPR
jgi:hypothetical protein